MQVGYGIVIKDIETGEYMSGLFSNETKMMSSLSVIPQEGMPPDFKSTLSKMDKHHILFYRGEFIENSFFIKKFMNFYTFPKREGILEFIKRGRDLDRLFPDLYKVALNDHMLENHTVH